MTFTKACCAPGEGCFQPESPGFNPARVLHGIPEHRSSTHFYVSLLRAGVEWEGTPQGRVRKIAAVDGWLSVYLQEPKGHPSSAVILISGAQACAGALAACPCRCPVLHPSA